MPPYDSIPSTVRGRVEQKYSVAKFRGFCDFRSYPFNWVHPQGWETEEKTENNKVEKKRVTKSKGGGHTEGKKKKVRWKDVVKYFLDNLKDLKWHMPPAF